MLQVSSIIIIIIINIIIIIIIIIIREGFFAVGSGLKERGVLNLLTIEDILGSAGLKDVTKGVRSVLADFLFLRLKGCVTWN